MRDARVDGFMPSISAAPPGPETFPFVCFKALIMVSRSCRFNSSRVDSASVCRGLRLLAGIFGVSPSGVDRK